MTLKGAYPCKGFVHEQPLLQSISKAMPFYCDQCDLPCGYSHQQVIKCPSSSLLLSELKPIFNSLTLYYKEAVDACFVGTLEHLFEAEASSESRLKT